MLFSIPAFFNNFETIFTIGTPFTSCTTFDLSDFILVPFPAARIKDIIFPPKNIIILVKTLFLIIAIFFLLFNVKIFKLYYDFQFLFFMLKTSTIYLFLFIFLFILTMIQMYFQRFKGYFYFQQRKCKGYYHKYKTYYKKEHPQ